MAEAKRIAREIYPETESSWADIGADGVNRHVRFHRCIRCGEVHITIVGTNRAAREAIERLQAIALEQRSTARFRMRPDTYVVEVAGCGRL